MRLAGVPGADMNKTVKLGDGVPCRLAYVPEAPMLNAMRAAMTTSRAYSQDADDAMAIAYASWLVRRSGATVPASSTVRAVVEREVPEGLDWSPRNNRAKAVRWERGGERSQQLYNARGKFKGYGPSQWECDEILLRIEIPNWDHVHHAEVAA